MFKFDDGTEEVTTTENETDSTDESNAETTGESAEPETISLTQSELDERIKEARKDQDKRWKDRIKGLKGDEEGEGDGKESKESAPELTDRLDRADLRSEGVKDKAEQDIVLEYARFKKIDVLEALTKPAVKAELKEYRNKSATPSSSSRTTTGSRDEVAYWAEQTEKGKMAPTADLRRKVLAYLSERK
jgi:hypothetical protein